MPHRAVIIQSNYVPWKGYFDLLAHADTVVLLDSVQSTKNDWRNRNQIKTTAGKAWLTVPIKHSNALRIRDVEVATRGWQDKHFRTLAQAYARAPHAPAMLAWLKPLFESAGSQERISQVNRVFIRGICDFLGIAPRWVESEDLLTDQAHDALSPTSRLVEICTRIGASAYLSGPAARSYLDEAAFAAAAIAVDWFDYDGYPEYPQLHGPFDHAVSVLDTLLMTGSGARGFVVRNSPSFLSRSMP